MPEMDVSVISIVDNDEFSNFDFDCRVYPSVSCFRTFPSRRSSRCRASHGVEARVCGWKGRRRSASDCAKSGFASRRSSAGWAGDTRCFARSAVACRAARALGEQIHVEPSGGCGSAVGLCSGREAFRTCSGAVAVLRAMPASGARVSCACARWACCRAPASSSCDGRHSAIRSRSRCVGIIFRCVATRRSMSIVEPAN